LWIKHGYAAPLLLVCFPGRGQKPQVYFATNISAQRSTRRCLEAWKESNENACKISQPRNEEAELHAACESLMHAPLSFLNLKIPCVGQREIQMRIDVKLLQDCRRERENSAPPHNHVYIKRTWASGI
jgi:hypothetical protein